MRASQGKFVLAGMLLVCTRSFALNPALDISQYAHTPWRVREGFTKAGYLERTKNQVNIAGSIAYRSLKGRAFLWRFRQKAGDL